MNKVLARIRNLVVLVITAMKQYALPNNWKWEKESVLTIEPGEYKLTFEEFLLEGEEDTNGEEMLRRVAASGCDGSLQHALWLEERQHLVPKSLRGKYLVFPKAVALVSVQYRYVLCLGWGGRRWSLDWRWLGDDFGRRGVVVRARKSPPKAA